MVTAQYSAQTSVFGEDPFAQPTTSSSATPHLAQEPKGGAGSSSSEVRVDELVGAMAASSLDGGASSSTSQPVAAGLTSSQPQAQSGAPVLPAFSPTTTPIPGRPLLRNGLILVMPPTWDGCDACKYTHPSPRLPLTLSLADPTSSSYRRATAGQGTGFICGDPSEPHDPCWAAYGRTWREGIEYSDEVVERAMILQQGLPEQQTQVASSSSAGAGGNGSGSAYRPPVGPPPQPQQQQPRGFTAPSHPPPPRHPSIAVRPHRPRSPPRVNRAQEAGEAGDDALGEAPPAYEDVLRAPVGMALPPQSRMEAEQRTQQEQEHERRQQQAASSATVHAPPPHAPPPLRPPIPGPGSVAGAYVGGGGYGAGPSSHWRPPPLSPPQHPPPPQGWSGYPGSHHHHHGGPSSPYHQPYPLHHQPSWGAPPHQYPHPHAHQPVRPLYVQPGDARIGGMLCWKCEGTGTKTSWFWGDEGSCSACGGLGRIR